jgi:hypothetical protein
MLAFEIKRMLFFCLLVIALFSSFGCDADNPPQSPAAEAFKVVVDENGKYWFEAPDGNRFLSLGINHVYVKPDDPRPGSQYYHAVESVFGGDFNKWKEDIISIMTGSGFNTFGAWSEPRLLDDDRIYSTISFYVAGHGWERCMDGFLPDFEQRVRDNVNDVLKDIPNIDNVFGVFLDNEMRWYGESPWTIVPNYTVLERGLKSKDDPYYKQNSPYYRIASNFLKNKYKTADAFSKAWGKSIDSWDDLSFEFAQTCMSEKAMVDRDEFTALAAEKFYSRATKVVREMLPGKLILGTRFAQRAPEGVIRACGKYCDVISFNDYRKNPKADDQLLAKYFIWGGEKALMVTEYSWRGEENTSGNRNTKGAGTVVKTQAERGANYSGYVEDIFSYPMVVGAHWFEFADQSPQGRGVDIREDSNYGIVDIKHRPYKELLRAMTETNKKATQLHALSSTKAFTSIPGLGDVIFEPGQRPERPPFVDLLTEEPTTKAEFFHADDASISFDENNVPYVLRYDTAKAWGCGMILHGPKKYALSKSAVHATDLDGYSELVIDAKIPAGLSLDIFVDEAGVGPAYEESFETGAGDDGESFIFKNITGTGERSTYTLRFKDLEPRTDYGNQRGKRRIDLNATKGFAFYLRGHQGSGIVKLHSVRLQR